MPEVLVPSSIPDAAAVKSEVTRAIARDDGQWRGSPRPGSRAPSLNIEVEELDPLQRPYAFWPFGGPGIALAGGGAAAVSGATLSSAATAATVGVLGIALIAHGVKKSIRLSELERRIGYRLPRFRVSVALAWTAPDGTSRAWSARHKAMDFRDEYPFLAPGEAKDDGTRRRATIEAFARHLHDEIVFETGWTARLSKP